MTNVAIPIQATGLEAIIGRKIRNLMLDHELKATDVARHTGMEATGLSRRLAGKRGWEPDDLSVISYVFNVSVAYLFGEVDRLAPLPKEKHEALAAQFPWATVLPHLDSNQEPIGSKSALISSLSGRTPKAPRKLAPAPRPVISLRVNG
jgi:transcriptional regulator with XRE-family HTH domain